MTFTDASCWPTLLETKVLQWFLATAKNSLLVLELAEVLWRFKKKLYWCLRSNLRNYRKKNILKGSLVASGLCGTFIFKSGIYLFTRRVSPSPLDHFRTRNHMQESQQTNQDLKTRPTANDQSRWFTCNHIEKRINLQLTCALWVFTVIVLLHRVTLFKNKHRLIIKMFFILRMKRFFLELFTGFRRFFRVIAVKLFWNICFSNVYKRKKYY